MRDALTYLDQCYAMADKEITLDNVNETLGLISDENLDEIISAVKAKDRAAVGAAITNAFRSGLSANLIAESLITRLRDMEFDMLDGNAKNFSELDNFIDALRKALGEMYGSGIPDIILEMTLLKLAAPAQNFIAPQAAQIVVKDNLDAGQKIFYDTVASLSEEEELKFICDKATVTNFSGDVLTVAFRSPIFVEKFKRFRQLFEKTAAQSEKRAIKISVVYDKNLPPTVLKNMSEPARTNLGVAMEAFNATDAEKID